MSAPEQFQDDTLRIFLPPLQKIIRYYDEFSDQAYSIPSPESSDEWLVTFDGRKLRFDFRQFPTEFLLLLKHWSANLLNQRYPTTAFVYFSGLCKLPDDRLKLLLRTRPTGLKSLWKVLLADGLGEYELAAAKSLLDFLCNHNLCGWNPDLRVLLSQVRLRKSDKFAAVRKGEVFLTAEEESALISCIDTVAERIRQQPKTIADHELRSAALLVCSYQFGLRPKQIALLRIRDVRIWPDASIHLTFMMIKQRSVDKGLRITRRVKREWAPIFQELLDRQRAVGAAGDDRVFAATSTAIVAGLIGDATAALLPHRRSATELRHTAAQRLVDAGATQEELAAFMGHSDLESSLVYYQASPSQAARVNAALGISETYQQIVKIARDRFITSEDLSRLKGSQQIGGVPHSIPITGIGGCSSGQPACPYNPVMSCYGCSKFMPVSDLKVHQGVLEDFRGVVKEFSRASRGDNASPTYMQLQQTIAGVQAVVEELEKGRL